MNPSTIVATGASQDRTIPRNTKPSVLVPCRFGLHLRVVSRVVIMARKFDAEIQFRSQDVYVNAKSIFGMLELSAEKGKRLFLVARGPDADKAIQEIMKLFESASVLCQEAIVD